MAFLLWMLVAIEGAAGAWTSRRAQEGSMAGAIAYATTTAIACVVWLLIVRRAQGDSLARVSFVYEGVYGLAYLGVLLAFGDPVTSRLAVGAALVTAGLLLLK